ncbi:MAG: hypothetical protein V3R94_03910 [Acidobacteriota bacterium]
MNWNEDWLKADRPPASEHPKKYTFIPSGSGRVVFFYFVFIIVLDYLALTFLGGRPVVIAGMPLLIWITVVFAALTIAGIMFFSSRNNDNSNDSGK